jgi:VanZ family protein
MKFLTFTSILILIGISYLSLRLPGGHELPTNDKVGHFVAYACLSTNLLLLTSNLKTRIVAISFSLAYGIIMEFFQSFIPERESSLLDMLANSCGVFIGYVIFWTAGKFILHFLKKIRVISPSE